MIEVKNIESNIIQVISPETLTEEDLEQFLPQVDSFIKKHGKVRLLVDASNFDGWKNLRVLEKHMEFIKSHHKHVEKIALIEGHLWQRWIASIIRVFLNPDVKIFEKGEADKAKKWVKS